jgi:hypothetical protein
VFFGRCLCHTGTGDNNKQQKGKGLFGHACGFRGKSVSR